MPRDAFVLKIQKELCRPKCARKVSGLSRNRPQDSLGLPYMERTRQRSALTNWFWACNLCSRLPMFFSPLLWIFFFLNFDLIFSPTSYLYNWTHLLLLEGCLCFWFNINFCLQRNAIIFVVKYIYANINIWCPIINEKVEERRVSWNLSALAVSFRELAPTCFELIFFLKNGCLWRMNYQPVQKPSSESRDSAELTLKMASAKIVETSVNNNNWVLLRTPITQMFFFNQGMLLLGQTILLSVK